MNPFSIAVFAAAGTHVLFQDLLAGVLELIPDVDPSRVAEETLSLLAVVGARAVEEGSAGVPTARLIGDSVLGMPYAFRDYTLGSEMLADEMSAQGAPRNNAQGAPPAGEETDPVPNSDIHTQSVQIGERLAKIQDFYEEQFPVGTSIRLPILQDKLVLWMGRISPPGLDSTPAERVTASRAPILLAHHARLITAYVRHAVSLNDPDSHLPKE